jgi:FMN reductase
MVHVVLIASSPTSRSRIDAITQILQEELIQTHCSAKIVQLRDLPHSALLAGNREHPQIRWTHRLLRDARAVVLVTPTYQVAGSPLLRAWLELLPSEAFTGKAVETVGLGALRSHAVGLGSALGDHAPDRILTGCFLYEQWLQPDGDDWLADSHIDDRITRTVAELHAEIDRAATAVAS